MTRAAGRPAYQALAAELRAAILSGEFPPDRMLPTEAQLAATHEVSRQTVRQAFAQLVAESLVFRVRGRGTFATPYARGGAYLRSFGSVDELLGLSFDTELEILSPLERRADVEAAGRLRLATDDVMTVASRRLHEGVSIYASRFYLPVEVARKIDHAEFLKIAGSRTRDTIIGLIEKASIPIAGAHQSITAVGAPANVAEMIEAEPGDPVLRIDRLYFDRNGESVQLAINHCNPIRYAYRIDLRRTQQQLEPE